MSTQDRVFAKCAWRLIPFMGLLYLINFIDRTNAGFAALTMNADLGFSPTVFGFGAGIFFLGYAMFQLPANLILERMGARRWIFSILLTWGFLSASNAFVETPTGFYAVRFFLGVAEAGFFPGMLLYLTYWFPRSHLSKFTANFMVAIPLSFVVGGPLASLILGLDGVADLQGWQWLFLIEGMPAVLLAFVVLKFLPDSPADATWLTRDEKAGIAASLTAEDSPGRSDLWSALVDLRVIALGLASFCFQAAAYGVAFFLPQIVQAMGFSIRATGIVVALVFVAGAGAMIVCGHSSSSRRERIWHTALPWLIAALGFAAAGTAQSDVIVLAALTLGATFVFAPYGAFFSLPPSFLRGTAAAGGIGLFNTFGSSGGFFGPALVGLLTEGNGDYTAGLVAVSVGFVLAALIVLAAGRMIVANPLATKQAV